MSTKYGTPGTDHLHGTASSDSLYGYAGDDWLRGYAGNDWLFGDLDDDVLNGGEGADHLIGGEGKDTATYAESDAGVEVNLATGHGAGGDAEGDQLYEIEVVIGSVYHDDLTGDDDENELYGMEGNDTLRGGNGKDILDGGAGNDVLSGNLEDDTLKGGSGADTLYGGDGWDDLFGGADADTFVFIQPAWGWDPDPSEPTPSEIGIDYIWDFSHAEGDKIDLSLFDAVSDVSGHQSFTLIGTSEFNGAAGELRYEQFTAAFGLTWTAVHGDTNGDGAADFSVVCTDKIDFVSSDFML